MKINAINLYNNHRISSSKKENNRVVLQQRPYKPSFYGTDLVYRHSDTTLPKDISEKLPQGSSIQDAIKKAKCKKNKLGEGANSTVYAMPDLDDYVLKVLKRGEDPNKININEFPSDINLGQPVWKDVHNPRFLILKRIKGKEHSISNWSRVVGTPPLQVTSEQAGQFAKQIATIANMPQSSFDRLASEVKLLDDKGYKLDSLNPNNVIVNEESNEIHIIDYFKVKKEEAYFYKNSCYDLIGVMCDFTLFPEYIDKMSDSDKHLTLQSARKIADKVYEGSKKAGLSTDLSRYTTYVQETSKWFPIPSVKNEKTNGEYIRAYDVRMKDFILMLTAPEYWAERRE